MTHWLIAPIVMPALLAPFIILAARYHIGIQRTVSVAGVLAMIAVALGLAVQTANGDILLYQLGDWAAPFGIVLVGDSLSTMMVLLMSVLALFVILYAIGSGWDERGRHFHALFQFQLMGIAGAFLTGDLFNLFVFFEVLLIASYGLMIHGGGNARLRAGVQYVLFNLLGSTLFLFALGALYAETGTLNMADLAQRATLIGAAETVGIRVAAVLLILVFAIKAAIVPLHFWLPSSYAQAPGPVAALFAIMTKVGAYAIIRVYTLIFPPQLEATAGLHGTWLLPVALLSMMVGAVGVLAARKLDRLVAFAVIGSMGMVMVAVGLFTVQSVGTALYYMIHSTLAAAALFLIVDLVKLSRPHLKFSLEAPVARAALVSAMFMVAAIAMAGLPPLSGFLGKLMVLNAGYDSALVVWIWGAVLLASLLTIVGFARAGSMIFWKAQADAAPVAEPDQPAPSVLSFVAVGGLLTALIAHTVFAGPVYDYTNATAARLFAPQSYIDTVLGTPGKLSGTAKADDPATDAAQHGAKAAGTNAGHGDGPAASKGDH